MAESTSEIFARIALEKGFLDEKKLEQVRVFQRLARREGNPVALERACVELEILSAEQVKGIERGVMYYVVRKADKVYGKLAVAMKYADRDTVEHCLERQHREFMKRHRLVRLSKLLMGLDAVTPRQDEELRAQALSALSPEESRREMAAVTEPEPSGYEAEQDADEPALASSSSEK